MYMYKKTEYHIIIIVVLILLLKIFTESLFVRYVVGFVKCEVYFKLFGFILFYFSPFSLV